MSQADIIKETIAYLKFWLGIMVVLDISLVGWLLAHAGESSDLKAFGAVIGVSAITFSVYFVHKRIETLISTLKDL